MVTVSVAFHFLTFEIELSVIKFNFSKKARKNWQNHPIFRLWNGQKSFFCLQFRALFVSNLSTDKTNQELKWKLRTLPQCYRQWLYRVPRCITLKIKIWVVAYLKFIIFFPSIKKKKFLFYFMQLFSADAKIFLKNF